MTSKIADSSYEDLSPLLLQAGLKAAIDEAYEVFAPYKNDRPIEGCPCCKGPRDAARLVEGDLAGRDPELITSFATAALYTWGTTDDFKHLLPRILELLVTPDGFWNDAQVVFNKFPYANWQSWPAIEIRAVDSYFDAAWRALLSHSTEVMPGLAEEWLEGARILGRAVQPMLDAWLQPHSQNGAYQLVLFLHAYGDQIASGELKWSYTEFKETELPKWFSAHGPALSDALHTRYAEAPPGDYQWELDTALHSLNRL